jgi:hypothetical protein
MEKPHRFLLDRIGSYADEGGAFLRRRRLRSRPFARIHTAAGEIVVLEAGSETGDRLHDAAAALIELAGED